MTLILKKGLRLGRGGPSSLLITPRQPVAVDPYFSNVSLLLHGNGTNGSASIIDSSPSPKTVTAVGNAQISTAQSRFGGASIAFDGTGDYVVAANNADFTLPEDYTIEFWIYPLAFGAAPGIFTFGSQTFGANGLLMFFSSNRLYLYRNGAAFLTSSLAPLSTAGSWQHVAAVRRGTGSGNTVLYVSENAIGSGTDNTSFAGVANNGFCLGAQASLSAFTDATFTGFKDEIRITKAARYATGTGANAGKMVHAGTNILALPTAPFPDA